MYFAIAFSTLNFPDSILQNDCINTFGGSIALNSRLLALLAFPNLSWKKTDFSPRVSLSAGINSDGM